jgi:branched-chain amino acid transport system ATP-binding protein
MSDLALDGVSVSYGESTVLRDVDLAIEDGETVGIIGPNGAGKTTLVKAISGLKGYEGSITYGDMEVSEHRNSDLVEAGLVQVSEEKNLFGPLSVRDNLKMGSVTNKEKLDEQLELVYSIFPRLSERKTQMARTLSGGEQQMLAIGRGLMADPELLIIDEPSQGLAPVIIDDLSEAVETLYDDLTLLIVEQNAQFVFDHTETAHILENGQFSKSGKTAELAEDDEVKNAFLGVE